MYIHIPRRSLQAPFFARTSSGKLYTYIHIYIYIYIYMYIYRAGLCKHPFLAGTSSGKKKQVTSPQTAHQPADLVTEISAPSTPSGMLH